MMRRFFIGLMSNAFGVDTTKNEHWDAVLSRSNALDDCSDVERLRETVKHLYDLLDDIDTAGDMAKSNDAGYRKLVEQIQRRKNDNVGQWGGVSSDGYTLFI